MTYGVAVTTHAPIEVYDTLHQELLRRAPEVEGLLLHLGRPVQDGFQVLELWDSKDQFDRYNAEIVWPVMGQVLQDQPAVEPSIEEFEVHGLLIPTGGVAY